MGSGAAASGAQVRPDTFWWQGATVTIVARSTDTGGAMGVADGIFPAGFGPPLHVHHREDEALLVIEGELRVRQGDRDLTAGPGTWVWGPRGVPHAFRVESERARVLVVVTPGGFEEMFEVGGVPADSAAAPPEGPYDPAAAVAIAERFGFEVVGPQLTARS